MTTFNSFNFQSQQIVVKKGNFNNHFVSRPTKVVSRPKKVLEDKPLKVEEPINKLRFFTSTPVKEGVSFAEAAKKNAISNGVVVYSKIDRSDLLSKREARQDYTRAKKKYDKELQDARGLVEAIAARYPKLISTTQLFFQKKRENNRRNRAIRQMKRHPAQEVKWFPKGIYFDKRQVEPDLVRVVEKKKVASPTSVKQRKIRVLIPDTSQMREDWELPEEIPPLNRLGKKERLKEVFSQMSRTELARYTIASLFMWHYREEVQEYASLISQYEDVAEPQMDVEGVVGVQPEVIDQKGSVALHQNDNIDRGVSHPSNDGYLRQAVASEIQTYQTMTDRWLYVARFDWTTSQGVDSVIKTLILPRDILTIRDSQLTQLFYLHRYWRSGMKIKFQLNTNPFQIGQLMAVWTYGDNDFVPISSFVNIYSGSQRNHCLLNAGSSNDGEISIPYHHINSVMTRTKKTIPGTASYKTDEVMGQLDIMVVNRLAVSSNTAGTVGIVVYAAFENSEFSGMISRDLGISANAQMDTALSLANAGCTLLRTLGADGNRDNPPQPLQPVSLVPQAMPSFSYMTNVVEPINVLRADPRGQTPHPLVTDEMKISKLVQGWGLFRTIEWRSSQGYDTNILVLQMAPLLNAEKYPIPLTTPEYRVYPPVSVVSSMFGLWRGDLLVKIRVVASKFHTGRLMIGMVPRGEARDFRISTMRMSPHETFDIVDSTELVFRVNWYWDNAWARVKSLIESNPQDIPSLLGINVLNPLLSIEGVVPSVYLNVYLAAAENFELALPRSPTLSLVPSSGVLQPSGKWLKPYNKEAALYTTWERNLEFKDGKSYAITMYIQNVQDGWLGFVNLKQGIVYKLRSYLPSKQEYRIPYYTQNGEAYVDHVTYDPALSTANAHGLIVFASLDKANAFAKGVKGGLDLKQLRTDYAQAWVKDGRWSEFKGKDGNWIVADNTMPSPVWAEVEVAVGDFEVVIAEPNMDTSSGVVTTLDYPALTTSMGLLTFGERIDDLKSLCRRWIHYASVKAKTSVEAHPRDCVYTARIPVHPVRKVDPKSSAEYDNRVREGQISLCAAPYLFWRGGMRFRFMICGSVPKGAALYVQHRFDQAVSKETNLVELGSFVSSANDMLLTQYATFCQAIDVNAVVTVEVPYYQPYEKLHLTRSKSDKGYGNGMLYIWVHSLVKTDIAIEVYYSLADDTRFSIFQGFPPLYDLGGLGVESQMNVEGKEDLQMGKTDVVITADTVKYDGRVVGVGELDPGDLKIICMQVLSDHARTSVSSRQYAQQHLEVLGKQFESQVDEREDKIEKKTSTWHSFWNSLNPLSKANDKIETVSADVTGMTNEIKDTSKKFKNLIQKVDNMLDSGFIGKIRKKSQSSSLTELLAWAADGTFKLFTHIMYMIISPTVATVVWGLINIYHIVWGFSMTLLEKLITPITNLWNRMFKSKTKNPTQPTQGPSQVEPQMEDEDVASYASVLFMGLASVSKLAVKPPTSWKSVGEGLFDMGQAARHGMNIKWFVQQNLDFFRNLFKKFLGVFGYSDPHAALIAGVEDERMKTWLIEASAILDPSVHDNVCTFPDWSGKVFELVVVGRAIQMCLLDSKIPVVNGVLLLVSKYLDKLVSLEKELIQKKVYAVARYEPWCLWLGGDAGVGKTVLAGVVAEKLANKMKYKGAQSYYVRTPGQEYFDGFEGQPTILLDEMLAISPTANLASYAQFLVMKSSGLFNPPYAQADQKDKQVNFFNLIVCANDIFFNNLAGLNEVEAYNRRRDCLLQFKAKRDSNNKRIPMRAYTSAQIEAMEHVEVYYFENPMVNDNSGRLIGRENNTPYSETVMAFIMGNAAHYHKREAVNYESRSLAILRRLQTVASEGTTLDRYLKRAVDIVDGTKNKDNPSALTSLINGWRTDIGDKATFGIEAQMDEGGYTDDEDDVQRSFEQYVVANDITSLSEGEVIEPCNPISPKSYVLQPGQCLHSLYTPMASQYLPRKGVLFSYLGMSDSLCPTSVDVNCCRVVKDGNSEEYDGCILKDRAKAYRFWLDYLIQWEKDNKVLYSELMKTTTSCMPSQYLPPEVVKILMSLKVQEKVKKVQMEHHIKKHAAVGAAVIANQKQLITVGNIVLPRESRWKSIPKTMWKYLVAMWKVLWKVIVCLSRVLLLILGAMTAVGLLWRHTRGGDIQSQMTSSADNINYKKVSSVKQKALSLVSSNMGTVDMEILDECRMTKLSHSSFEGIKAKLAKNTFFMVASIPREGVSYNITARCTGLFNKNFIVLRHYIEHFKNSGVREVKIVFHKATAVLTYDLNEIQFQWTDQGYGMGVMPQSFPRMFANVTKYIPSEKFDGSYPYKMQFMEIALEGYELKSIESTKLLKPVIVAGSSTQESWTIHQGFQYGEGGKGKCGSLILAPELACPWVGIHTAGRGTIAGFAELLLQETFIEPDDVVLEYVTPNMERNKVPFQLEGEYEEVGTLDHDMTIFGANKTKIKPSLIAGVFPVKTEPAPLIAMDPRLKEPRCPLQEGCSKRCLRIREFPRGTVNEAYEHLSNLLCSVVKPLRTPGKLEIKQAVEGFELAGYDSMEMTTSEGYPWVLMRPRRATDKSWLFQIERRDDGRLRLEGINPDLLSVITLKEQMRKRGVVPATYFTACLKDARILKEKVGEPGKTRVFEISPVDLTISQRQLFLDFSAAYSMARLNAENTIGINPDGVEWTILVEKLVNHSPYILTADYSGYGPRMSKELLLRSFLISIRWYDQFEEDHEGELFMERYAMAHEIMDALHVVRNLVFRPTSGMPSGNPETVVRNSIVNSMYIRIAYLELAKRHAPHLADLFFFTRKIVLLHNGDDLIMSVSSDIIVWFNNRTLIDFFSEYGLKMTDALKSGVVREYCSIEEASYLKRGFMKHPRRKGEWMAPLEESSITDTANWIWRSTDDRGASLVNSEMCARLAYTRGPDYYLKVCKRIQRAWQVKHVNFEYPSWDSLDKHVWEGVEGPTFGYVGAQMDDYGDPIIPGYYEGWSSESEIFCMQEFAITRGVLRDVHHLQKLDFSLQVDRSQARDIVNAWGNHKREQIMTEQYRFPEGVFICLDLQPYDRMMMMLRTSLSYRDPKDRESNGKSNFNDALVSYHQALTNLKRNILGWENTYTRDRVERSLNIVWHP